MLEIKVGGVEHYNDSSQEFTMEGGTLLQLEHSLVSLSKWESIHEKPFLGTDAKTSEESLSYIECMILTPEYPDGLLAELSHENFEQISAYVNAKMTATWFRDGQTPRTKDIVTAELIYYWMTVFNIPFECQYWHLNRLFTLIRVCGAKQEKPKKMSRAEAQAQQRELNARRRAQLGSKG